MAEYIWSDRCGACAGTGTVTVATSGGPIAALCQRCHGEGYRDRPVRPPFKDDADCPYCDKGQVGIRGDDLHFAPDTSQPCPHVAYATYNSTELLGSLTIGGTQDWYRPRCPAILRNRGEVLRYMAMGERMRVRVPFERGHIACRWVERRPTRRGHGHVATFEASGWVLFTRDAAAFFQSILSQAQTVEFLKQQAGCAAIPPDVGSQASQDAG